LQPLCAATQTAPPAAPPATSPGGPGELSEKQALAALFPAGRYYAEVLAEDAGSAGGAAAEAPVEDGSPVPAVSEPPAREESPVSTPVGEAAAPETAPEPEPEPEPAPAPPDTDGSAEDSPDGGSETAIAGFMNYTVRRGDDLSLLARRFGTTPEVIASESGIPVTQTLYPGMSLRVPTTDPAKVEPRGGAVAVPWSEVNEMWEVGTVAQVTDVWTGNIFYVMRRSSWAHADAEPVSHRDTAIMLENYGGQWSWARRPIVVVIDGRRIAASQNGMPHGRSSLDNGFPGHFCIHFLGSTTHGSSYTSNGVPTVDAAHQRCVLEAVGH
jgi:LysM repeat protein